MGLQRTNFDSNDAVCLDIVHTLQHPVIRSTSLLRKTALLNAREKYIPHFRQATTLY